MAAAAGPASRTACPRASAFPPPPIPRDPDTLFLLPLNGDSAGRYPPDASTAVWRTRDAGRSWQDLRQGLPQRDAYFAVLRQAMATDALEPAGVYFGTNTGSLFASGDEGESWTCVAQHLPTILSVETLVVDGLSTVQVSLPAPLVQLFPGAVRQLEVEAASVAEVVAALDSRWPGMRDRLCDSTPRLRRQINVFVEGERATLATPLAPGARVIVMMAIVGG